MSWGWIILAFVVGFYTSEYIQLFKELRDDRQQVVDLYTKAHKKYLERHKN